MRALVAGATGAIGAQQPGVYNIVNHDPAPVDVLGRPAINLLNAQARGRLACSTRC